MDGPNWRDKVPPMKILSTSTPFVAPTSSSPTTQQKVFLIHFICSLLSPVSNRNPLQIKFILDFLKFKHRVIFNFDIYVTSGGTVNRKGTRSGHAI